MDPRAQIDVNGFPAEFRKAACDALLPWHPFLPSWVHLLNYTYRALPEDGEADTIASVSCMWEYRSATLTLYARFFDSGDDDTDRARNLLHEIVHMHVAPLRRLIHEILLPNGKPALRSRDEKDATDYEELCVEEIVTGVAALLSEKEKAMRDAIPSPPDPPAPGLGCRDSAR